MSKAGGLIRDHSPPLSNVIILLCSSLWKLLFLVSWLAMYTPFRPFIFVRSTNASLAKCLEKNIPQILKLLKILYQLGSFYTCTNGILLAWITFLAIQKVAFCHKDVIKISNCHKWTIIYAVHVSCILWFHQYSWFRYFSVELACEPIQKLSELWELRTIILGKTAVSDIFPLKTVKTVKPIITSMDARKH